MIMTLNLKIFDEIFNDVKKEMEAAVRFELTNKGFADLRLRPLGHAA